MLRHITILMVWIWILCPLNISRAEVLLPSIDQNTGSIVNPNDPNAPSSTQPYTPGVKWGGISLSDGDFYEIPPEKCAAPGVAELIGEYGLTDQMFLFKSDRGYGVVELDQTYRDLETGVRRKGNANCRPLTGIKIAGDIDCKGVRTVQREPYEQCAYEAKIWGHSLSQSQAFDLIHKKVQGQFTAYKQRCVPAPQAKPISERAKIGF